VPKDVDELLLPAPGARNVPTNTLIWLNGNHVAAAGTEALRLRDGMGDEVDYEIARLQVMYDEVLVVRPRDELQPGDRYQLLLLDGDHGTPITHFFTGAGPDHEPPAAPAPRQIEAEVYIADPRDSCGDSSWASLSVDATGDLLLLDIGAAADLDEVAIAGHASDLFVGAPVAVEVGSHGCLWNWPEAGPTAKTTVRAIAYDLAGNTVGWSEAAPVELPDAPGGCGGCSGGDGLSLAALATALALSSRRKASRR
jgi:hypothetical protein